MEYYLIDGGKKVQGDIPIAGAKNVAGKLILASLLAADTFEIRNVPDIGETSIALEIFQAVGGIFEYSNNHLFLDTRSLDSYRVPELTRKNRLPILALGPLLHQFGKAEIPKLGGDKIGPRPVNFHIKALRKMGVKIHEEKNAFIAINCGIHGTKIKLPYPSVGATENIILTATLAHGDTIIENAAQEPEIMGLIVFLQKMGAQISLGRDRTIFISGVKKLQGANHLIMPDRIEAVSYASIALATGGDVLLRGAHHLHLITYLGFVKKINGNFATDTQGIRIWADKPLIATDIKTDVHPGFMTDWQQPSAMVLTQAQGRSRIHETVYEDRLGYLQDLQNMGIKVKLSKNCHESTCRFRQKFTHVATIMGPTQLQANTLIMPDIRAGMAYVIAALVAEGKSKLYGLEHLDRGYENLEQKLQQIGVSIQRRSN